MYILFSPPKLFNMIISKANKHKKKKTDKKKKKKKKKRKEITITLKFMSISSPMTYVSWHLAAFAMSCETKCRKRKYVEKFKCFEVREKNWVYLRSLESDVKNFIILSTNNQWLKNALMILFPMTSRNLFELL